ERISQTVLYPTTLLGIAGVKDLDVAVAQCRAYNDWLADFCSQAPERLFGIAIIPQQDVEAAAAEIRRASKVPNLVGTFIRPNPVVEWRHFHDPVYDPMWQEGADPAADIRRASKVPNLVGPFIRPNPVVEWLHFHDPVYDPMWQAASDAGLPIG